MGNWNQDLFGINEKTIPEVIRCHRMSTEQDRSWYKVSTKKKRVNLFAQSLKLDLNFCSAVL